MADTYYFDRWGNYLGNSYSSASKYIVPIAKPLAISGGNYSMSVAGYNNPKSIYYVYSSSGVRRKGYIAVSGEIDPMFLLEAGSDAVKQGYGFPGQANLYIANLGQASAGGNMPTVGTGGTTGTGTGNWDGNGKFHRNLKLTTPFMSGADIRSIQGLLGVSSDGIFGPATSSAVKGFQSKNGLTSDGIIGCKTACKMRSDWAQPYCTCSTPSTPSSGGGPTGGGSAGPVSPPPTPPPPPPPPKPQPPYKLPKYQPASTGDISMLPYSFSDMAMAVYDIFNAYELSMIAHNRYFETIQPSYSVVSNMIATLKSLDSTKSLIDTLVIDQTLANNIYDILQTYAYGILKPTSLTDKKRLYSANKIATTNPAFNRRAVGAKFISSDTQLPIGTTNYNVSIIQRRMQGTSASLYPIKLTTPIYSGEQVWLRWQSAQGVVNFKFL